MKKRTDTRAGISGQLKTTKYKEFFPWFLWKPSCLAEHWSRSLFLDEGGVCSDDKRTTIKLFEAAFQLGQAMGIKILELRHRNVSPLSPLCYENKVSVRMPLHASSNEKWKQINVKVRNQVRKAKKSGLTVHWEGGDSLGEFYEVFAENMRDLGSPVHSRNFFRTLFQEYGKNSSLLLVRKGQNVIGGGVCLKFKDILCIPWASSLRQYRSLCPNVLMYWEAIRWGCDSQFALFDFGRSTKGEGTYTFKMQWGSVEEPLHWQRCSATVQNGAVRNEKDKYAWVASLWSYLSVPVTKVVGPWIRKQVSLWRKYFLSLGRGRILWRLYLNKYHPINSKALRND